MLSTIQTTNLTKQTNLSQKIRYLHSLKLKPSIIIKTLNISYQHYYNTIHRPLKTAIPFIK